MPNVLNALPSDSLADAKSVLTLAKTCIYIFRCNCFASNNIRLFSFSIHNLDRLIGRNHNVPLFLLALLPSG
jgi:hypothetical protein